jgi:phosphohistidine phosphatase
MKTVHLIRHAKSSWNNAHITDVERTLNARGHQDCKDMANPIYKSGCRFDTVFCSVAERAQLTIQGMREALSGIDLQWQLVEELYTFDDRDLLDWFSNLPDTLSEVVIVGHNPAITEFTNRLSDRQIANVPTCGYVCIEFPSPHWIDLSKGKGRCKSYLTPKELRESKY